MLKFLFAILYQCGEKCKFFENEIIMNTFCRNLALILTSVGVLNWGLIVASVFDLVAYLFGPMSVLSRITYIVIGLSALAMIFVPSCSLKEVVNHRMN